MKQLRQELLVGISHQSNLPLLIQYLINVFWKILYPGFKI